MPSELTFTDKILARTLLPLIPRSVTPNSITWFRFISIPFVGYLLATGNYIPGLILFFFSSFSDAIDGALARTRNQVTVWGQTYDPFADKLLIGVAVFILVSQFLNIYLTATIIGLEFFFLSGLFIGSERREFLSKPKFQARRKWFAIARNRLFTSIRNFPNSCISCNRGVLALSGGCLCYY